MVDDTDDEMEKHRDKQKLAEVNQEKGSDSKRFLGSVGELGDAQRRTRSHDAVDAVALVVGELIKLDLAKNKMNAKAEAKSQDTDTAEEGEANADVVTTKANAKAKAKMTNKEKQRLRRARRGSQ